MADKLQMVDVDKIHWEHRFREDMGDIEILAESIREKGVLQPITVTPDFKLLAGERRLTAAKMAGLKKIPALVRAVSDVIDQREIELMENVFRKDFSWQEECALIREIDQLYKSKNIDWSGRKTAQLLNKGVASVARALQLAQAIESIPEIGEYKTAEEALKALKRLEESVVIEELHSRQAAARASASLDRGIKAMLDIADHNYRVGDTFAGLAELRSNGAIHIIECDPPYGIDLPDTKMHRESPGNPVQNYNEVPGSEYPAFLKRLCKELFRVAGPNCWMVFWFGPTWQHTVLTALREAGWEVDDIPCIWVKPTGQTMHPELYLARCYEPFYLCRKGKPAIVKRGRSNIFEFPPVPSNLKYHPTQRPVELIQEILEALGVPGSVVLCPFLGSGATIRAAYNAGMKVFGWDISPEYKPKLMLLVEHDARKMSSIEEETGDA